jgi:flagellar basal-body rod protein FlgB
MLSWSCNKTESPIDVNFGVVYMEISGIESITTASLRLALDAATLRHQGIAQNIANANTEGYVPQALNFEVQLDRARRSLNERGQIDPAALSQVSPRLETARQSNGQMDKVRLDIEVANLAQNAVQYQALIKGVSRHYAILSSAVSDGKK